MARRSSQGVDWATLFREWRDSGLTQPEFCQRRGVSLHTFRRRLYHPDARPATVDARRPAAARVVRPAAPPAGERPPDFLPVRVVGDDLPSLVPAPRPSPGRPAEVILAGGRRIAVPPGFDAETLLRLIAVLEPTRC